MASVTNIAAPAPTAARSAVDLSDIGDPTKMPDHEVTFSDVLSTLNPLQYIPIIGSIYRAVTGDKAPEAAQVLGGALLGGPLGLIASAANAVLEQSTGKDVGDRLVAWLTPDSAAPAGGAPAPQYAANTAPAAPAADPAPASGAGGAAPAARQSNDRSAAATASPPTGAAPAAAQAAAQPTPTVVAAADASAPAPANAGTAVARGAAAYGKTQAGWTLANYRTFAGMGVPPPTGANGAQLRNNPVPLQTTIPLPGAETTAHAPVVPAMVQTPANAAPAAAAPAPASQQPQDTWVSEAMMRGLDRYRQMMRQQEQQPQQQSKPEAQTSPNP